MAVRFEASSQPFWSHASVLCCGLGVVVALLHFVPGSSFLRMDAEGMTVRSMWRSTAYRWSDIEQFGVAEIYAGHGGRHRMVGFNFNASCPGRGWRQPLRRFNRWAAGFEDTLPDNYGLDCATLADRLNQLRERHAGASDAPPSAGNGPSETPLG